MYLGIDFGTTYSTISIYVDNDQHTGLLPPLANVHGFPTLMRFDKNELIWFYGSETDIEHYPQDTIKDIKAKIRESGNIKESVQSGGTEATFDQLLQDYLAWLIRTVVKNARDTNEDLSDEHIKGITVTVPCGFTGRGMTRSSYGQAVKEGVKKGVDKAYREMIETGVRLAGVGQPPITIIEEPVAAAMDYLHSSQGRKAIAQNRELKILVADLGGGTFDVTVVKYTESGGFKVAAKTKEGDLHLGGNDFDNKLLDLLISKIKQQNPDYRSTPDRRRLNLLRATITKERLSEKAPSGQVVFTDFDNNSIKVTRQEFEDATRDLLQRAMELIRRCVNQNGGIGEIDKIVLVGGGCRMPQIRNGIENMYPTFSKENIILYKPSYAIANGAAYYAVENVTVQEIGDIATCTYGFQTHHGDEQHPYIRNMILKGTEFNGNSIESTLARNYSALYPNQSAVTFQVFESNEVEEKVAYDANNERWVNGKLELNDDRFNSNGLKVTVPIPSDYQGRADEYMLDVKMVLDCNGILKLEVYHEGSLLKSDTREL